MLLEQMHACWNNSNEMVKIHNILPLIVRFKGYRICLFL